MRSFLDGKFGCSQLLELILKQPFNVAFYHIYWYRAVQVLCGPTLAISPHSCLTANILSVTWKVTTLI